MPVGEYALWCARNDLLDELEGGPRTDERVELALGQRSVRPAQDAPRRLGHTLCPLPCVPAYRALTERTALAGHRPLHHFTESGPFRPMPNGTTAGFCF